MKGRADLTFELEDPKAVYAALIPETEDSIQRSEVRIEEYPEGIRLIVESEDVVSLRAALNTWIRLIKISYEMVRI